MTYDYAFEKRDMGIIDKLNKLTNANTFQEDVRKLVRNTHSDHALSRWQVLAEIRYEEIQK